MVDYLSAPIRITSSKIVKLKSALKMEDEQRFIVYTIKISNKRWLNYLEIKKHEKLNEPLDISEVLITNS